MAIGPNKSLLIKYVLHDCTPEDVIFVESWIKNDADIKHQVEQLKLLYQAIPDNNQLSDKASKPETSETDSKQFIGWIGIIAVLLLILVLLVLFYFLKK